MKQKMKYLSMLLVMLIIVSSCKEPPYQGTSIGACKYTKTEKVSFSTAIKLRVSANLMSSNYYNTSGIFVNNFFNDLKTSLSKGDTGKTYRGQVSVRLKSSGKNCSGDNKETIPGRDSRIGGNYLKMKVPSSTTFLGTATTTIRSDDCLI